MTKIAYCSDLHLGFGQIKFNFPDADILILAGDILEVADLTDSFMDTKTGVIFREFLIKIASVYKTILYLPGNHEYYGTYIQKAKKFVDDFLNSEGINNIIFSDKIVHNVNDLKIICATLWTDINKNNPIAVSDYYMMNDYKWISILDSTKESGGRNLLPQDTMKLHQEHKNFIENELVGSSSVVLVSHHVPATFSCRFNRPDYFYSCTDMDHIIYNNPSIKKWIFGHTHTPTDIVLNDINFLSNPRGYYGHEPFSEDFIIKVFEV